MDVDVKSRECHHRVLVGCATVEADVDQTFLCDGLFCGSGSRDEE